MLVDACFHNITSYKEINNVARILVIIYITMIAIIRFFIFSIFSCMSYLIFCWLTSDYINDSDEMIYVTFKNAKNSFGKLLTSLICFHSLFTISA